MLLSRLWKKCPPPDAAADWPSLEILIQST